MEWDCEFSAREAVKATEKISQIRLIKLSIKSILQKDDAKEFSRWQDQCYQQKKKETNKKQNKQKNKQTKEKETRR